ncbi:MAG: phosphomannomutase [Thermoplasmata archaeon]|nr:phosphomannomutase [Thermoplasmata archaeon]
MGDPFLAYDIRGRVGDELNEELARSIGIAYCNLVGPKKVVIGQDVRQSSASLSDALAQGLMEGGADVLDIGLCGTEMIYFATPHLDADGGIMVTASHNPRDYNGMKMVTRGSIPLSRDNGLHEIRDMIKEGRIEKKPSSSNLKEVDVWDAYIEKLVGFLKDPSSLSSMKFVTDPGHGCAGPVLDRLEERLDLDLVKVHNRPDGSFPAGIPNPLLPEMRGPCSDRVRSGSAEMGIAWDGDFDRCFLFDEKGGFVEGYYIVGLLAKSMLSSEKGGKVVHDPRLIWNTVEIVKEAGGIPIMNRTGHAFIKDRMRQEDAIYGGEMSAHHYFRDFNYCDTGMVPWLLIAELMAAGGNTLSELLSERVRRFPVSGEINRRVDDPLKVIDDIEGAYGQDAISVDHTDGVSLEFERYRFNLRSSNTEPLIRLNVESRGDKDLLDHVTNSILDRMDSA